MQQYKGKYPKYSIDVNLQADKLQPTIRYLSQQAMYTQLSLKPSEQSMKSIEDQQIFQEKGESFTTNDYVYFTPKYLERGLFRVPKQMFREELTAKLSAMEEIIEHITEVITLDQIYSTMLLYEDDDRVQSYLKLIENDNLDSVVHRLTFDSKENCVAVTIKLLQKQYCIFVKNIVKPNASVEVIFNVRPDPVFNKNATYLYYIQRSEEGAYRELVARRVDSLSQSIQQNEIQQALYSDPQQHIIYKSDLTKQLRLTEDKQKENIFLILNEYGNAFTEEVYLIEEMNHDRDINIKLLLKNESCRYSFDINSKGIVFCKFMPCDDNLRYGHAIEYAHSVILFPRIESTDIVSATSPLSLKTANITTDNLLPPIRNLFHQVNFSSRVILFECDDKSYIGQVQYRHSHLLLALGKHYVYNKTELKCIPYKQSVEQHSIWMEGEAFKFQDSQYHSQLAEFQLRTSLFVQSFSYLLWKKELTNTSRNNHIHVEQFNVLEGIAVRAHVHQRYLEVQQLPVLLFIGINKLIQVTNINIKVIMSIYQGTQQINDALLQKFLQKGVMLLEYLGRGSNKKDATILLQGAQLNVTKMLKDLERTLQFIGNNLSRNISLYCKGGTSSLIGALLNVRYPFLLTATVLHNGIYDLSDPSIYTQYPYFFGSSRLHSFWQRFDIFTMSFKYVSKMLSAKLIKQKIKQKQQYTHNKNESHLTHQQNVRNEEDQKTKISSSLIDTKKEIPRMQIGTLQHILLSTDSVHKMHSRRLIHHLRSSAQIRYSEVYLQQNEVGSKEDLRAFGYLHYMIKQRVTKEWVEVTDEDWEGEGRVEEDKIIDIHDQTLLWSKELNSMLKHPDPHPQRIHQQLQNHFSHQQTFKQQHILQTQLFANTSKQKQ